MVSGSRSTFRFSARALAPMLYPRRLSSTLMKRETSLDFMHDIDRPQVKPKSSALLSGDCEQYRRALKPKPCNLPAQAERSLGVRRYLNLSRPLTASVSDLVQLPADLLLDPLVDKGRRFGRRQLADHTPRDPVKGINCVSTDMFIHPTKRTSQTHNVSTVDLTSWLTLSDDHPKVVPKVDTEAFRQLCETTRKVYRTTVSDRQEVGKSHRKDTHDLLSWL
jgi:hypothetical protein